jgi:hypothetical protein
MTLLPEGIMTRFSRIMISTFGIYGVLSFGFSITPTLQYSNTPGITTDLIIYYENSSFFWTLSGVLKPFQRIGFRPALTFLLLTPGPPPAEHLKPE